MKDEGKDKEEGTADFGDVASNFSSVKPADFHPVTALGDRVYN